MKFFLSIIVFVILLAPGAMVFGAEGLVTCDGVTVSGVPGVPCDFCKFAEMMDNVIDFIVGILILISVIMLAVTGIQMAYTAAGAGDARALLKDRLTNIVIGFILIMAAWTLVDVLIKVLVVDDEIKNWRSFVMTDTSELCAGQNRPTVNVDRSKLENIQDSATTRGQGTQQ